MSGAVHSLSFQDLIEAVESMPLEDQSMLVELINKRIIEKRRELPEGPGHRHDVFLFCFSELPATMPRHLLGCCLDSL